MTDKTPPFSRAVVVGAGTMGNGIAHVTALAGIRTTLVDVDQDRLDGALASEKHPGLTVEVLTADGTKCERCWNYTTDVGSDADLPGVCARCAGHVREIGFGVERS